MHILVDDGYLPLTDDYRVEVSRRIREEYENGRDYYAWHGRQLSQLPSSVHECPSQNYLNWHRDRVYLG